MEKGIFLTFRKRLLIKYQFQFFFCRPAEFIRAGHFYYIVAFGQQQIALESAVLVGENLPAV